MIWNQAHSVSLHRWCLCACVHYKIMNALTFPPPSRLQSTATIHTEATFAAGKHTKLYNPTHTWAPSFTDSQHQVRKEMLFHGEFSFRNKSKGNSGLCCGLTRRNSQTPQMRLHLRAKEREHYYYYDCKSEWMNGASSCPHITLLVLCLAWVWVATVLYIQGDVFHQTVATYVQNCIVLFVLCWL